MSNNQAPVPHSENEEPTLDWEKHLRWFAPLTAFILIAATVFMWTQSRSTNVRSEALQAFISSSTADQLQTVAEAYPDQPEASLASLQAGGVLYRDGAFEKALSQYERFLANYPSHAMVPHANWGKWMSQESLGELEAALQGYKSLSEEDLFYPQALLGQARIMEKQNRTPEAQDIYGRIQEEFPDSNWAEQAQIFSQRAALGN